MGPLKGHAGYTSSALLHSASSSSAAQPHNSNNSTLHNWGGRGLEIGPDHRDWEGFTISQPGSPEGLAIDPQTTPLGDTLRAAAAVLSTPLLVIMAACAAVLLRVIPSVGGTYQKCKARMSEKYWPSRRPSMAAKRWKSNEGERSHRLQWSAAAACEGVHEERWRATGNLPERLHAGPATQGSGGWYGNARVSSHVFAFSARSRGVVHAAGWGKGYL